MDSEGDVRTPPALPLSSPLGRHAPPTSTDAPSGLDTHRSQVEASPGVLWRRTASTATSAATAAPRFSASPHNAGVANCYVFKSRLQEYAQKVGIPTPVYQTVKEGPSHEPVFQSTVIVNDVSYESLPGFYNRKAAEQSAAEIALMAINKAGERVECIPVLHETGLCKNLLQEYAQKMNYAIPSYICTKQSSGPNHFMCKVEIGGIQYIGGAAKTKKEAEIKAARTALLAIRSSSEETNPTSQFTVVPEKKGKEPEKHEAIVKPKKAKFKKRWLRKKFSKKKKWAPNTYLTGAEALEGSGAAEAKTHSDGVETVRLEPQIPETNGYWNQV